MKNWRGWLVSIGCITLLVLIIYRLYLIQISDTQSFSTENKDLVALAEKTYREELVLTSGRGKIVDRNGHPFVGEASWRLLLFPQSEQQMELHQPSFRRLAETIHSSYDQLHQLLTQLQRPMVLSRLHGKSIPLTTKERRDIESLRIPGVHVIQSDDRVTEPPMAQQVLGRVVKNPLLVQKMYAKQVKKGEFSTYSRIGMSGLEQSFEPYLHGEKEERLTYITDGRGKALNGGQVQFEQSEAKTSSPYTVVTTLDQKIQAEVERILHRHQVAQGAAVVQEIETGNVLAMGSQPSGKNSSEKDNPWHNQAIMETTPGSIFKLVVAVAAMAEGKVGENTSFACDGYLEDFRLRDAHKAGHGSLRFSDAFASSCNVVFGQVSNRLGGEVIDRYAKRLGLGQAIIWSGKVSDDDQFRQLPHEQTGMIFSSDAWQKDAGAVVQTGIGQRDLRMTPIQAANMVTALFHRGKTIQPRLVTQIEDTQGKIIQRFPNRSLPQAQLIPEEVLQSVRNMMKKVVTQGTGSGLQKAKWQVAGKTGTAQVGDQYNKWMIGFAPAEKPRYAVSVVLKNIPDADDRRSLHIFREIMDGLYQIEKRS